MIQVPTSTPVSLQADSLEMAETYNATSIHQFNNGKVLISLLKIEEGKTILDVGAGTGQLGAYVAQLVGSTGRVVGVDPLAARVDIARGRSTGNFEMHVGQAEDLSQFPDCTFDVVYLNSVFHWISDKPRGLAEIFRVLKPGGRVGFNVENYLTNTINFVQSDDVISGLVKAGVFGFLIALMGCYQGYNSKGGAQGVGAATTNAVVSASILILAFDYVLTEMFFSR